MDHSPVKWDKRSVTMVERTNTTSADTTEPSDTSDWGTREVLEASLAVGGGIAGAIYQTAPDPYAHRPRLGSAARG